MYIKIKHIKKILLVSACIFLAGFNYLTYVKADSTDSGSLKSCDKNIDADCDGLTDAEEKLYGTDANSSDSDDDGYSDGVEVKSGYDPAKPAPGDRITTINTASTESQTTTEAMVAPSLTDGFIEELQGYTDSKGSQPITSTDLQSFMGASIAEKTGAPMTWESLPDVDRTQVKILKQSYASLNEAEKKARMQQDSYDYLVKMEYLIGSNLPTPVLTVADVQSLKEDFQNHLVSLSTLNPDIDYFADLGNRMELFLNQATGIEVPETMIDLHINFLRLMKGYLSLREAASPAQDPLAGMIVLKKVSALTDLTIDFFGNHVQTYFNQFQDTQK